MAPESPFEAPKLPEGVEPAGPPAPAPHYVIAAATMLSADTAVLALSYENQAAAVVQLARAMEDATGG